MLPGERQEEVLSTSRGAGAVGGIVINNGTTRRTRVSVSTHQHIEAWRSRVQPPSHSQ